MRHWMLPLLALLVLTAAPASADTVYTYTGDHFGTFPWGPRVSGVYTTADRITGSFTVADDFVPVPMPGGARFTDAVLRYSFTDGHQTLTEANSLATFFLTIGDANGSRSAWSINIQTETSWITSYLFGDRYDWALLDGNNWGRNGQTMGVPDGTTIGTWSVAVPEPMSLLLVVAGIGGLFGARRFYRS